MSPARRRPPPPPASRQRIALSAPFRLDLTVSALRRLPTNLVDVYTAEGHFLHAFEGEDGPVIVRVTQPRPEALDVAIDGNGQDRTDRARAVALVRRTLGIDRDVGPFIRAARKVPWLAPHARRLAGLRPPRYRSLWEAGVNAVTFQQVSLHAATAVVRRLVLDFGTKVESHDTALHLFPVADQVLRAGDARLRRAGLSAAKIATLRRLGEAIASGTLSEPALERLDSAEAAARLQQVKGIGPWTATVILLRGLGRLDVFPMNDSGVARNLTLARGRAMPDVSRLLDALGPQRGMLYFHLLLARLEARGEVGLPSIPPT